MPSLDDAGVERAGQTTPITGRAPDAAEPFPSIEHVASAADAATTHAIAPDEVIAAEAAPAAAVVDVPADATASRAVGTAVMVAATTPANGSGVAPAHATASLTPVTAPLSAGHVQFNLSFGEQEKHQQQRPASVERAPRVYMQTLADEYVKSAASGDAETWSRLLTRFADDDHSEVVNTYFCRTIAAGVVLTFKESETGIHKRGSLQYEPPSYVLHLSYPVVGASPWVIELLLELNRQHLEVRQLVPAQAQQLCMEIIFSIASLLLRQLEAATTTTRAPSPTATSEGAVTQRLYAAEVARSRTFFQSIIQRQYQGSYFRGMVVGIFAIAILGGCGLWWNANGRPADLADQAPVLISLIAGAIGALVSVMQRVTSGRLNLLPNAQTSSLLLVGSFRPVLGGLIAVVIFALLASGLLPIKSPGTGSGAEIYFFIAMAFFSGFSERFAQDTLAVGQAGLSGRTPEAPASAPAAHS